LGVLERMGLSGGVQLEEYQEEGEVTVRIRGAGVQDLLRGDRRVHGALTHLANRAAQKLVQPDVAVRVETESGSGGEDRLEEMARSRAQEARSSGREVVLPPMDSRERWIVHNTLKTVSGIRTESVGAGRLKRVKILPA
jgi:spoIIIJ-associated protein